MATRMTVALLEAFLVLQNHTDTTVQRSLIGAVALALDTVHTSAFTDDLLPYLQPLRDWLEVGIDRLARQS